MKRFTAICLILSLCLSLTACSGYSISQFEKLVREGDYAKATELYLEEAYGNEKREKEIADALCNIAEQAISDFLADAVSYEDAQSLINTVGRINQNNAIFDSSKMDQYKSQLSDAYGSKAAYNSGSKYLENGDYQNAIKQLKNVSKNDSRYADAQEKINTATQSYKSSVIERAKQSADAGNPMEAAATVSDALSDLSDDDELRALKESYENAYVSQVLAAADAALVNPGTDYGAAIDLLRPAMQKFPDNTDLKNRYDYLMTFEPVSLFDLEYYTKGKVPLERRTNVQDNMGNVYAQAFEGSMEDDFGQSETYDIGKKYNTIKGTFCVLKSSAGSSHTGYLKIYGDGKLLYQKTIDGSSKPQPVEVNITGVTDLKIEMSGMSVYWYNTLFADVTLQKTVK